MTDKASPLVVGLPNNLDLHDLRRGLVASARAHIDAAEKQLVSLEGRKKSDFEKQLLTFSAEFINVARTCLISLDGDPFMSNESFLKSHNLLVEYLVHAQTCLASMAAWHGSARSSAQKKANILHSLPGGSRDKQEQMRELWASGKYSSRTRCAEEECAALDMSFDTARKALRNTPDPA